MKLLKYIVKPKFGIELAFVVSVVLTLVCVLSVSGFLEFIRAGSSSPPTIAECTLINPDPAHVFRLYQEKVAIGCKSVPVEYHKFPHIHNAKEEANAKKGKSETEGKSN